MSSANSIALSNGKIQGSNFRKFDSIFAQGALTTQSSRESRMKLEAALLSRCRANDRRAQRALFDQYSGLLYSIALRYTKRTENAQDVCADAWIKVFSNLTSFKGEGSFEGWIKRIVTNEALMFLRKKRLLTSELSTAVIATAPSPVRVTDNLEHEDVLRLLDQLPLGCRTVFNLYEFEGYKHREIAELLEVSINTSKSQLILAKKKLREAYLRLALNEGSSARPLPKEAKRS